MTGRAIPIKVCPYSASIPIKVCPYSALLLFYSSLFGTADREIKRLTGRVSFRNIFLDGSAVQVMDYKSDQRDARIIAALRTHAGRLSLQRLVR